MEFEQILSAASSVAVLLSSIGALFVFIHRTTSVSEKRAFEIIDKYHSNREFHDSVEKFKIAISKIDSAKIKSLAKTTVSDKELDDDNAKYLSDIYYIICIYNYWAMLVNQKNIEQEIFRKYLASIIVDELNEAEEILKIIDPDSSEFRYIPWLKKWWADTKKDTDFDIKV